MKCNAEKNCVMGADRLATATSLSRLAVRMCFDGSQRNAGGRDHSSPARPCAVLDGLAAEPDSRGCSPLAHGFEKGVWTHLGATAHWRPPCLNRATLSDATVKQTASV